MGKAVDITGRKFGDWTAIQFFGKRGRHYWLCRCTCGVERAVRKSKLMSGRSKSCGCTSGKRSASMLRKHGKVKTAIYYIWTGINQRCNNPNAKQYKNYGGRGIGVCDRWKDSFENFYADMGDKPHGASIDRIDNNGDYSPENCRWATNKEQSRNTRTNRLLTFNGETHCVTKWAEITGINHATIRSRLRTPGCTVEKALSTKVKHKNKGSI